MKEKKRRKKKAQNQNGKLMATRSNNTKLSFRLIGQRKERLLIVGAGNRTTATTATNTKPQIAKRNFETFD